MTRLNEMIKIARQQLEQNKQAFVGAEAAAGMPPGGDPAAMGAMPPGGGGMPMNPSMMGAMPPGGGGMPMDPSMMGGAPPMDPLAAAGGAGPQSVTMEGIRGLLQEMGMGGKGKGKGGAQEALQLEVGQMKRILGMIADSLGIQVPASEAMALPGSAIQQQAAAGDAGGGGDPMAQGGAMGGSPQQSAIQPMEPMQAASPDLAKMGSYRASGMRDKAGALAMALAATRR